MRLSAWQQSNHITNGVITYFALINHNHKKNKTNGVITSWALINHNHKKIAAVKGVLTKMRVWRWYNIGNIKKKECTRHYRKRWNLTLRPVRKRRKSRLTSLCSKINSKFWNAVHTLSQEQKDHTAPVHMARRLFINHIKSLWGGFQNEWNLEDIFLKNFDYNWLCWKTRSLGVRLVVFINTVEPPFATTSRKRSTANPKRQNFSSESVTLEPLVNDHLL